MNRRSFLQHSAAITGAGLITGLPGIVKAASKKTFKVAWSIYVGWMPWEYASHAGILKKWADKYGIEITLLPRMDYLSSIEAYVAEQVDACVMTNMECLDMPSTSGIDSTVVIVGDYSNGNDAILTRGINSVAGLKGQSVYLAELSVSHYLLARALEMNGLKESQVNLKNTTDSDIGPAFISNASQKAVVTWNPIVMQIEQTPGVVKIFTSEQVPGEILDLMVVSTKTLRQYPELGKALSGAWYETMGIITRRGGQASEEAIRFMANSSECSPVEYRSQLKTTAMFYTPESALQYARSGELKEKMNFVRWFCFEHGLLGENASSVDIVGISYPDGTVQGDPKNIKMRYDSSYMESAALSH